MSNAKIVIIGAGSASFGLENLTGIMANEVLQNNTSLVLVDIHESHLKAITALANQLNMEWKSNIDIRATPDRRNALEHADFIVLSVAVDREETWLKDHEIAKKYGLWHYAENGGPGSFCHTARGLAFIKPILSDIREICPNAWLINYTNPVPRIGYAAQSVGVKCVGLCHQIWHGYGILGRYMAHDLGITENLDLEVKWNNDSQQKLTNFVTRAYQEYELNAAGLNHFTWMVDIRRRGTWEDMYPSVRMAAKDVYPGFEPLTQKLFSIFGLLPVPGDCHLAEYLPFTNKKEEWDNYRIQLYDLEWGKKVREEMWNKIIGMVTGKLPIDLYPNPAERADQVIAGILTNANAYEQAVNIRNNGSISNLPDDAIVEVPALINSSGFSGTRVGPLPESIAALCRQEISVAKLITQAAMNGDREIALQAFLLMIDEIDAAENLLDEYLEVHRNYLPQFFH